MLSPKKIALSAMGGLLALSTLIGGATYAIFKDDVSNGPSNVQAGELIITAKRDDIPNIGPMFYTENTDTNYGAMPTGLWAPGDKHTRGLFLENIGSLEAKLTTITATPADSLGNLVTSGAQYDDDMLFASQSRVKIWEVQEWDPTYGSIPFTRMDGTEMDLVMDVINQGYNLWLAQNPGADLSIRENLVNLLNAVNELMLQTLNDESGTSVDDNYYKVVQMYERPLSDLVNTSFDASSFGIALPVQDAALLAFTVEMDTDPGQGIDRNSMQGKSVYFNFGTDWNQTRNNP